MGEQQDDSFEIPRRDLVQRRQVGVRSVSGGANVPLKRPRGEVVLLGRTLGEGRRWWDETRITRSIQCSTVILKLATSLDM